MNTVKIQQRGTLTLPKKIRESLGISEGNFLRITEKGNTVLLEKVSSGDEGLLRDIKSSLDDIKRGKYIEFSSVPEFKKKLKKYAQN